MYPETFQGIGLTGANHWTKPEKLEFTPHKFREQDIDVEVEACAICGSDIHHINGDWPIPYTPLVPGHEIVGKIVRVGKDVKKGLKVGDRVGIGAQADCDDSCLACQKGAENYCKHLVPTYASTYPETGEHTFGGDALHVRVNSKFAFKIPDSLETKHAAPLFCGGITGFAPLLQAKVGKGTKVGVSGIGGIGHMAILFAKALGAEVTAISRNNAKKEVAKELGADHYAATDDPDFDSKYADTLEVLLNTSSTFKGSAFEKTLNMLQAQGQMLFITAPPAGELLNIVPGPLLFKNISVTGSLVGSPSQIEYMLELAAKHQIKPWVECMDMNEENLGKAWQRTLDGDVRFRFTMVNYDKFFKNK